MLVVGDAVAPTGFARVTRSIFERLRNKYEIHQLGIKYMGGPHDLPWTVYPAKDIRGLSGLSMLARELEPDLVFMVNDYWVLVEYVAELSALPRVPRMVAYCPMDAEPIDPAFVSGLDRIHRLVTYTEFGRRELVRAAGETHAWSEVEVIPHGVDSEVFRPLHTFGDDPVRDRRRARAGLFEPKTIDDDTFIVLNANRNQPRKRIDVTMKAFAAFSAGRPNTRLYLHMGTEDAGWDIKRLAERLDITEKLMISMDTATPPRLADEDLNRVYNACDVGINTASSEGWGLVSFEHAATGAAQIVPDHTSPALLWSGAAELIEIEAHLTEIRIMTEAHIPSLRSTIEALTRLYEDRRLLNERCLQAYARATSRELRWDSIAERWSALFDQEIAAHRRASAAVEAHC